MSFCIEIFSLVKAIHAEHAFISIHRPPPKPKQQVEATSTLVTARTVAERRVFSSNACKAHVRHNSEGDVLISCNSPIPNARPVLGVEFGMSTSEASFASFFQAVRSAPDLLGIQRKWIQLDGKVNWDGLISTQYCRWKKSQTTTWDVLKKTANIGINYQPQLVSRISEPSTV